MNIYNCPSDSDPIDLEGGEWNLNEDPNGLLLPCRFRMRSYNYYSWVIINQQLLGPGVDENKPGFDLLVDCNPDFLDAMFQVIGGIAAWGAGTGDGSIFDESPTSASGLVTGYRIREGIERFFITDINNPAATAVAQSEVFVMLDDLNAGNVSMMNHVPGGCNVLYMDAHVEFVRYPGKTPVSVAMAVLNRDALDLI